MRNEELAPEEDVRTNQDENEAILKNAVGSASKNIDKIFDDANAEDRIVAIMASMDRAIASYMHENHGASKEEINRYLAKMYRVLGQVHEMCESGEARVIGSKEAAERVTRRFWG